MWGLSCLTRDRTHVPYVGRRILNHWTTGEAPSRVFLLLILEFFIHPPLWSKELSKLPSLSSLVKPFTGPETYRPECQLLGMAWKACQKDLFLLWSLLLGFSRPSQHLTSQLFRAACGLPATSCCSPRLEMLFSTL